MNIDKKKSYQLIVNLTDEEVRELDRQRKSSSDDVDYDEWYESEYVIQFCEKLVNEITGMLR